ncbi:hypothetical protein ELQ88_23565 [Pseudomonas sp. MPC6]|nr:hypothetical protein ELQ88_23565 [Pseudomonas sp. MPC6]
MFRLEGVGCQDAFAGKPAPTSLKCTRIREPGRPAGRLALALALTVHAPSRGFVPVLRSGPTEQDRSLGEAPNDRGKSAWLLGAFPSDPP